MVEQLTSLRLLHHKPVCIGALEQKRGNLPFPAEAGEGRSARNPANETEPKPSLEGEPFKEGVETYVRATEGSELTRSESETARDLRLPFWGGPPEPFGFLPSAIAGAEKPFVRVSDAAHRYLAKASVVGGNSKC